MAKMVYILLCTANTVLIIKKKILKTWNKKNIKKHAEKYNRHPLCFSSNEKKKICIPYYCTNNFCPLMQILLSNNKE